MKGILQLKLSKQQLLQIDVCCIYFKVTYLSNMVTPDGIHILEEVLNYALLSIINSKINWPLYDRPSEAARQL